MKDLLFVLSAGVLAIVVGFITWDIASRKAYRTGHRDGWNAREDKLREERARRSTLYTPEAGSLIHVTRPNGDSYVKRAPEAPRR